MKITVYKEKSAKRLFVNLPIGACFKDSEQCRFFMKTSSSSGGINCVRLCDGWLGLALDTEIVEIYDAELKVKKVA